ncbi:hypothetical protein LJC49_08700, partial [Ruminococcaceae bacterium OttesenSCG-928-I18]|nr:hypothetical protein [Ruminococcaceae bacterium OttesenSCG-928-I18]
MYFGEGQTDDGAWRFFDYLNGNLAIGEVNLPDGRWTYYTREGMQFGEQNFDGRWLNYDIKKSGAMSFGKTTISDGRTVFYGENDGSMLFSEFCSADGNWYFADPNNGNLFGGEMNYDGRWLYYDPITFAMYFGVTPMQDGRTTYHSEQNGAMMFGEFQTADGKWYFADVSNGQLANGWTQLPNDTRTLYYTYENGMAFGVTTVENGMQHYFSVENGNWITGWIRLDEGLAYFDAELGRRNGVVMIEGKSHYFEEGFLLATEPGWVEVDGGLTYIDPEKGRLIGWATIGGQTYYFKNGLMSTGQQIIDSEEYFFAPSDPMFGYDNPGSLQTGWVIVADKQWRQYGANGVFTGFTSVLTPDDPTAISRGFLYYVNQMRLAIDPNRVLATLHPDLMAGAQIIANEMHLLPSKQPMGSNDSTNDALRPILDAYGTYTTMWYTVYIPMGYGGNPNDLSPAFYQFDYFRDSATPPDPNDPFSGASRVPRNFSRTLDDVLAFILIYDNSVTRGWLTNPLRREYGIGYWDDPTQPAGSSRIWILHTSDGDMASWKN